MIIIIKKDIINLNTVIPKGTRGYVKALQWGDKGEKYIVDFPQASFILVNKEDASVSDERKENASKEQLAQKKKRQSGKSEREEELQASLNKL